MHLSALRLGIFHEDAYSTKSFQIINFEPKFRTKIFNLIIKKIKYPLAIRVGKISNRKLHLKH